MLQEKEEINVYLGQSFETEKQKTLEQWQGQLTELQFFFNSPRVKHDNDLQARDVKIQEL